jgi:hypothetical protein
MPRIGMLLLVVLAVALGSCGGSDDSKAPRRLKGSTIPAAPGPTGSSGPTSSDRAGTRSSTQEAPPAESLDAEPFDVSSVMVSFLEKSYFGAKSQVAYFVATNTGQTPLEQARACVGEYLRKAPSAYCYAFSSKRAFGFSRVSRHPPARMGRPCWSAYWGKPKGRRPIGAGTNDAAAALHCPGASG